MKKEEEKRIITLPTELYQRIEERVEATGFDAVDEYVIFVLDEILAEGGVSGKEEEEEEVKKRLRALGYLG